MVVGTILHEGEGGPHFTQFFILFWVGSAVITLNTKLLGGSISFFQSVSSKIWVIMMSNEKIYTGLCSWLLYCSTCWRSFILQTYTFRLKCKLFHYLIKGSKFLVRLHIVSWSYCSKIVIMIWFINVTIWYFPLH